MRVDMMQLKRRLRSSPHLDVRALRQAAWNTPQPVAAHNGPGCSLAATELLIASKKTLSELITLDQEGLGHYAASRVASMATKCKVAAQIAASLWAISHCPSLTSIDLSGLVHTMCDKWPEPVVRAIAAAVKAGAPNLRSLVLVAFAAPIDLMRTEGGGGTASFSFHRSSMCAADMLTLSLAAGDLPHVAELDLSSNDFGDAGLITLMEETMRSSRDGSNRAPALLANLRWLGLNDCDLGDSSMTRFAAGLAAGAFSRLEEMCFVGNRVGDGAMMMIADAASQHGALSHLVHLNLGSNEITDIGCAHLADTMRLGRLSKLVHLSLAVNKIGDVGVEALASMAFDPLTRARLEYLGLGANRFGDKGTAALARAIEHSAGLSKLHGLWLADNPNVGDDGAIALAAAFRASGRLRELFIHGLGFHYEGCSAIVESLPYLWDLRRCVIGRCCPELLRRIERVQQLMRFDTQRPDVVVCSWPPSDSPKTVNRPKRKLGEKRMPSILGMRHLDDSPGAVARDLTPLFANVAVIN